MGLQLVSIAYRAFSCCWQSPVPDYHYSAEALPSDRQHMGSASANATVFRLEFHASD